MTISNTSRTAGPFLGNGVTKRFPFAYKVFDRVDVLVALTSASGVETVLTQDADYTVTLNNDQNLNPGGYIDLTVAPASGTLLAATSNVAIVQQLELTNNGGFYPKVINDALDRMVINIQQLAGKIGQGLGIGMAAISQSALDALALVQQIGAAGGSGLVGFLQAGVNAILRKVQDKLREVVSVTDFGAKGDGVTDDTAAIQAALNYVMKAGTPKKLLIPNGAAGVYKVTASLQITGGGITIEWENPNITLQKNFNGHVFSVKAGFVRFINPGIDGNGAAGFTGGGIWFGDTPTYFTYDCRIDSPRIFGTKDSCILMQGPRGAAGLLVIGGSLLTYNASGASSGGYPSVRIVGAKDNDVSNRQFIGVTSSSQPLIDVTGMAVTKISNCFTGTIFFKGNPDVTGVGVNPYDSCIEIFIDNTYIRDGITISGGEVMVDNCLTHGKAPLYDGVPYGGAPSGFGTYGWKMTSDTIACRIGPTNYTSWGVLDESPNGHAIENQCSSFSYGRPIVTLWTGTGSNPNIGNGQQLTEYDQNYKTISYRVALTTGTTTTLGTGDWWFQLPFWVNTAVPNIGKWAMYRPGLGWLSGAVVLISTGSVHKVALLDNAGGYIGAANPASIPAGTSLYIDYVYSRG
jgi:hypothetical protein